MNLKTLHLNDLPSYRFKSKWTLGDVGEVIRRVGVAAKFNVVPEFPLGRQRRIDWVWMRRGSKKPVACFEIEGENVPLQSVQNDIQRFIDVGCRRNYIVTYGRRFNKEQNRLVRLRPNWNDRTQTLITANANIVAITLLRHAKRQLPRSLAKIAKSIA